MKVRDVIKHIEADGWYYSCTTVDHHHYRHAVKLGKVTVPSHPSDEVKPGTLSGIWRQAGVRRPK